MSNSSDSEPNVHYSDSEDVVAKSYRTRDKRYVPKFRFIRDAEKNKATAHFRSIDTLSSNDVIVQDGMMKAPPNITTPEVENIPISNEKLAKGTEVEEIENECVATPEVQIYNTRALSKYSPTYELERFDKNAMIIFNQEKIAGYEKRLGTDRDVEALDRTFKRFGFEVEEKKDLTKAEILSELDTFSNTDFTDYGCVAVVVLTHGSRQGQLRASDMPYDETEIINRFMNKPFLVSKPVLFIIQACRGTKETAGMMVHQAGRVRKDHDERVEPYTLPVESDMLVLHSSYIGNPSHRNELSGSWLIQSLCSKIDELADSHDLVSILTEVQREVAIDREHVEWNRRTSEQVTNKQMPVTTSTLIRKLYLREFREDEEYHRKTESVKMSSQHEVLDGAAPQSAGINYGQCLCFLTHFDYMKECLRYFVEENPTDITAQGFLNVANTFKSESRFDECKEEMLRTICNYLKQNAQERRYYRYLHMYEN